MPSPARPSRAFCRGRVVTRERGGGGADGGEELARVLRDPIRRRILFVLGDKPGGATIRQLAARLGEPPRRIRHYVELLAAAGLIAVSDERLRRGTIERAFAITGAPRIWGEEWTGRLEVIERKMILLDILRLTFDSVTEAIAVGTFAGRRGWCAARTWREVDAQGWEELAEIHERALLEVVAAVDRASERLTAGEEAAIPAISALILLPALPWEE